MNKDTAERLVRLADSQEGSDYLRGLAADFDVSMKKMLFGPEIELITERGAARALHLQLEKFTEARKTLMAIAQREKEGK